MRKPKNGRTRVSRTRRRQRQLAMPARTLASAITPIAPAAALHGTSALRRSCSASAPFHFPCIPATTGRTAVVATRVLRVWQSQSAPLPSLGGIFVLKETASNPPSPVGRFQQVKSTATLTRRMSRSVRPRPAADRQLDVRVRAASPMFQGSPTDRSCLRHGRTAKRGPAYKADTSAETPPSRVAEPPY